MRILLVEDEKALSAAVCKVLRQEKYEVDPAYTGPDGLDRAELGIYDAVILDVMLPEMDGFTVLRRLRQGGSKIPVLMLTARSSLEDRVRGLDSGADYYLPKPFQMAELLACLRAITRRGDSAPQMELSFAGVSLDAGSAKLRCEATGQEVKLGAKEYQLMELFLRNPKQIIPKELITERVWGMDSEAEYNNLEVYVSFLRKKLAFIGAAVKLKATRGLGYALEEDA
ncbi:MAG: response regulator transcription factor [Clostridia bacterium]|nr:response regulator transcription factor [Clostridia bacterium]